MKPALPPPGYAAAALAAAVLSLLGMASSPAAPAWWSEPATSIAGNTPVNDWAAANLGQLKHVATQAKAHLDFTLASIGGAGPEIDAMCQFTQQDNYAPAAVGQLKNVAKVFYDRLAQAQWNWQTGYPGTATAPYPWTGTVHAENAAPINIGQIKNAFSFDLSSWASFDQDADSMADGWEVYYGLNPGNSADGDLDRDNDGLTNREEYNANANPLTADTDGDFAPDVEEVEEGTDPRRDTSAPVTLCAVYDSVHWLMDYLPPANPQPWETSHPIWYEYFQRWDGQPAAIRPGGRGGPLYDPPGSLSGQGSLIDTAATLTAWNVRWDHTTVLRSEAYFRSDGEGSARTSAARLWLRGPKSSSPVTRTFVKLVRREVPPVPPLSGTTFEHSLVTFTIPANQNHSPPQSFTSILSPAEPDRSHTERSEISFLPFELNLHQCGAIGTPGEVIPRPIDSESVYEVVTLENADFDEQTNWMPDSMASANEANRQDALGHGNHPVDCDRDDDFVKLRLHAHLPQMPGSIELVMGQEGQGDRMQADDLHFYNGQGQRVAFDQLQIEDLQNPQGPFAPMLQADGLDLFVEVADLGQLTRAANQANFNRRRYADLILRLTVGGQVTEQRARIYRGGYWRNRRNGNTGTIAFYDGKGRYQDQSGAWQVDVGSLVHGPFNIQSGTGGVTDETRRNVGPTPTGWYGLWERTDFRTWWEGRARPQTDHTTDRNGQQLGYLQQGSYCQWSGPGNRTAYTHQGANPPSSIHFKFELVPWGHNAQGRTHLQIHPDGFNDGTAGCVGLQAYNDCCRVFFLLRHYFGTHLNVETP